MLSYVHAYHAGNHADILKHLTLSLILEHLCKKEKPFCVIDTHAGSGLYALDDSRALKTGEAKTGVEKMINSSVRYLKFFDIIQKYYEKSLYPGSPLIENMYLRPGDEQILCELHPTAFEELENCFYKRRKECREKGLSFIEPALHKRDGYEFLKAVTPPKIKRGVCIVDPSFEDASDFEKCGEVISVVHKKWPAGIIALWYPLVEHRSSEITMMKERISGSVEATEPKILDIQMEIKRKEDMTGLASLYGSGMFIVNFPYQLDEEMKSVLPELSKILADTAGEWSVELR
ncbi:MAG: 23S rRNA (adenine(2030)-N(6))-methyltransferase RlmJ [Treponema sp.]|nr:23S rRNA (adenine(2030)-N(6))-methyltransferase RlmJ [Treponema sp.]